MLLLLIGMAFLNWPSGLNDAQRAAQHAAIIHSGAIIILGMLLLRSKFSFTAAFIVAAIFADIFSTTAGIPQTETRNEFHARPPILKDSLEHQPLLHFGETQAAMYFEGGIEPNMYMREAMHPLSGMIWNVDYAVTTDIDRMGWIDCDKRQSSIANHGKISIHALRQFGIQKIISLTPIELTGVQLESQTSLAPGKQIYTYAVQDARRFVSWRQGSGEVRWKELTPYKIQIHVNAKEAGSIVVLRNAIPGWSFTGKDESGFIEIPVQQGVHDFDLQYSVPGLKLGMLITFLGLLFCLLFVAFLR